MHKFTYLLLAIGITLCASWLRFHQLGAQSLWNDEGSSYVQATRSFAQIAQNAAADIHPPLYYWLLKIWRSAVGDAELSLRALSALQGVLGVAWTFALAQRLGSKPANGYLGAVVAGGLVAFNTFQIYYSQEMRMYATLTLWSVGALWALVGFLTRPTWRRAVALGILNALGLWTQYAFPLVMIAQGGVAVLWLLEGLHWRTLSSTARKLAWYGVANALALVLFAPLMAVAIRQVTTWPNTGEPTPLVDSLNQIVGWLVMGMTYTEAPFHWISILLVFALFGLRIHAEKATWKRFLPLMVALVPIGFFLAQGLFREGNLKFLLPSQVGLALAIGQGVASLWWMESERRMIRPLARGIVMLGVVGTLFTFRQIIPPLYNAPAYQRDDYRGLVQTILTTSQGKVGVILNAPGQVEVFNYYAQNRLLTFGIPAHLSSPDAEIRQDVQAVLPQVDTLFAVLWGEAERDPNRVVETVLDQTAFEVGDAWFGDVRLARYALPPATFGEVHEGVDVRFGEHITLTDYAISSTGVQPYDALMVRLHWQTASPLQERYKVFVQLLNEDGVLVAQHDAEPVGGQSPTPTWKIGQAIIDQHALFIPNSLSTTHNTLIVGLYNYEHPNKRVLIAGGQDAYSLATITFNNPVEAK